MKKRINLSNILATESKLREAKQELTYRASILERRSAIEGIKPETLQVYIDDKNAASEKLDEVRRKLDGQHARIQEEIDAVEGRCKARLLVSSHYVMAAINAIKEKYSITMKAMEGAAFWVDMNAQDFPKAYSYKPESTCFKLEVEGGKWYLTEIRRSCTHGYGKGYCCARMPEEMKKAILRRYEEF